MDRLRQDLRYASRVLLKDRACSLTIVLTLALCIGANAAIFAVVNAVLLQPLPVPASDRFVLLYNSYPGAGVARASSDVPDSYDRLRETEVFDELALYQRRGVISPYRVVAIGTALMRAIPTFKVLFNAAIEAC